MSDELCGMNVASVKGDISSHDPLIRCTSSIIELLNGGENVYLMLQRLKCGLNVMVAKGQMNIEI